FLANHLRQRFACDFAGLQPDHLGVRAADEPISKILTAARQYERYSVDDRFQGLLGMQNLDRLVRGRCKSREALKLAQVLGIELAPVVVRDRPERADCFASDVDRNKQSFFCEWHGEEERGVAIKDITAGSEIARRTPTQMRLPCASDRGPVE